MGFLTACLTTSSFAANGFMQVLTGHKQQKQSAVENARSANTSYADFSGTWTGQCHDVENTLIIQNNENYMTVNDEYIPIGSVISEVKTGGPYAVTEASHRSFAWDKTGAALIMNEVGVIFIGDTMHSTTARAKLYINNGELTLESTSHDENSASPYDTTTRCALSKVQ